jgi:digeranylgeranylglycerophospholipid reductase
MFDVVVVGAGPCGCTAARCCAENGLSTLLLEEHGSIGSPVQCAGLLSLAAFEECCVSDSSILHTVQGARIVCETGNELLFDAGEPKAHVVDRARIDQEMALHAAEAGARIYLKTIAYGLKDNVLFTKGVRGREKIPYQLLIAADGPRSSIARVCGMARSPVYLAGIQADVRYEMDGRFVELYPHASPEFFGWAIPSGTGRARVGLAGQVNLAPRFADFLKKFSSQPLHLVTGTIPLGVMPKTYGNRVLFVGDAAGFAKPTSGGGIYTGVRSAKHAASVATTCIEGEAFSESDLSAYEDLWKQDFGSELRTGLHLFKIRQKLDVSTIDTFCSTLNDPDIIAAIIRYGDVDRPSVLLRHLAKKPAVLGVLGRIILLELQNCMKW